MSSRPALALFLLTGFCIAQDIGSRTEQIEQARAQKAKSLSPAEPATSERMSRFMDRKQVSSLFGAVPGLGIRIGRLIPGSGFALGPEYFRPDLLGGNATFRASVIGSVRLYYLAEVVATAPRLLDNRFEIELRAARLDARGIEYYGQGSRSLGANKSNFRREDTSFDARAGWRPFRRNLLIGGVGGYVLYNVGPGKRGSSPSTETLFTAADTPGLHHQTNYWRGGPFVEYNRLDNEVDPHSGTRTLFYYIHNHDVDTHQYSFRRYILSGEHYVSLLNKKRVLVFHANSQFTVHDRNAQVPFYLQPTLGGPDDLRGYPRFRFYDNHVIAGTAEYRWEVSRALDVAIFVDAGKVLHRDDDLNFKDIRSSAGFGFRAKSRNRMAARLDFGFSSEGAQVWLRFSNIFSRPPFY